MINFVFLSQLSHFYALTLKHSTLIYSHSCYSHRFWLSVHTLFSITSLSFVSHFIVSLVRIWRERAKTSKFMKILDSWQWMITSSDVKRFVQVRSVNFWKNLFTEDLSTKLTKINSILLLKKKKGKKTMAMQLHSSAFKICWDKIRTKFETAALDHNKRFSVSILVKVRRERECVCVCVWKRGGRETERERKREKKKKKLVWEFLILGCFTPMRVHTAIALYLKFTAHKNKRSADRTKNVSWMWNEEHSHPWYSRRWVVLARLPQHFWNSWQTSMRYKSHLRMRRRWTGWDVAYRLRCSGQAYFACEAQEPWNRPTVLRSFASLAWLWSKLAQLE